MSRQAKLVDALAALPDATPAMLRDQWQQLYDAPAPNLSSDLLRLGLAYRLQEQTLGGLGKRLAKQLHSGAGVAAASRPTPTLQVGAQLLRVWNGRTISVRVVDDGFDWDGRRWRSLSAIAHAVTGVRWSGPRFFGVGQ